MTEAEHTGRDAARVMTTEEKHPRRFRAVRVALLIVGPILALGAWHFVQREDRLCPAPGSYNLSALVYDEYDLAAMTQRGLNAELDRQPGAVTTPPWLRSSTFTQQLEAPRPQRPRYFLEYPHA